jgi:hypothetical protein
MLGRFWKRSRTTFGHFHIKQRLVHGRGDFGLLHHGSEGFQDLTVHHAGIRLGLFRGDTQDALSSGTDVKETPIAMPIVCDLINDAMGQIVGELGEFGPGSAVASVPSVLG